jgi:hypothetical protein
VALFVEGSGEAEGGAGGSVTFADVGNSHLRAESKHKRSGGTNLVGVATLLGC